MKLQNYLSLLRAYMIRFYGHMGPRNRPPKTVFFNQKEIKESVQGVYEMHVSDTKFHYFSNFLQYILLLLLYKFFIQIPHYVTKKALYLAGILNLIIIRIRVYDLEVDNIVCYVFRTKNCLFKY